MATKQKFSFGKILLIFFIVITILHIILFNKTDLFNNDKTKSTEEKTLDAIYFTTTSLSTIGYGDMYPVKPWGKILIIFEQIFLIVLSYEAISNFVGNFLI